MDKALQIVVTAMVLLVTSSTVIIIMTGQINPFQKKATNLTQGASCDIAYSKFKRACNCEESSGCTPTTESNRIKNRNSKCQQEFSCSSISN